MTLAEGQVQQMLRLSEVVAELQKWVNEPRFNCGFFAKDMPVLILGLQTVETAFSRSGLLDSPGLNAPRSISLLLQQCRALKGGAMLKAETVRNLVSAVAKRWCSPTLAMKPEAVLS